MGWSSAIKQPAAKTPAPAAPSKSKPKFDLHAAAKAVKSVIGNGIELHKVDFTKLVVLDFETYYDNDYTLRKLSTSEYIRDARFKAHMVGITIGGKKVKVVPHEKIQEALDAIDWTTHALLCHHTQFDAMILSHHYKIKPHFLYCTLSMARGLHSNDIGAGLDEVAQYYGVGNKIPDVLDQTKGVRDLPPKLYKDCAAYCAEDVRLTLEIFKLMLAQFPSREIRLINLTCRLFTDPVLKVDLPLVEKELVREIAYKEQLLLSSLGTPKQVEKMMKKPEPVKEELKKLKEKGILDPTPRDILLTRAKMAISRDKVFASMLEACGVEAPMKISPAYFKHRDPAKKWAYAFAKTDLAFTSLQEHPDQRVRDLVELRMSVKSTTNETRAGRFLKAGANGMALPVYLRFYGAHTGRWCMKPETEVLTPHGWVAMADWKQGQAIMQWAPDRKLSWCDTAEMNAFDFEGELVRTDSQYIVGAYTSEHRIPAWTTGGAFKIHLAGEARGKNIRVPINGVFDAEPDISMSDDLLRLIIAVQADGTIEDPQRRPLRFKFRKQRKIERLRALLTSAGIPFGEFDIAPERAFSIARKDVPQPLWAAKSFGSWMLKLTSHQRTVVLDELRYWDGSVDSNYVYYTTTHKGNAEMIATLATLSGRAANIHTEAREAPWNTRYTVTLRERTYAHVTAQNWGSEQYAGKVYCPTVETGFFLVRSEGKIFVTGNSGGDKMNMQNLKREDPDDPENTGILRKSILAPKGYKIVVVDSGQIEARVNAWLAGQEDLLEAFRKGDRGEDRDVYCKFADKVYGHTVTKKDKLERFVGKVAVLGLGYQMGANKFQNTLALGTMGPPVFFEEAQCKQIVNTYRRENYKITQFWDFCAKTILPQMARGVEGEYKCLRWEKDKIWLPNGMALKYPNLRCEINEESGWEEWSYERKGERAKIYGGLLTENIVQALARIIVGEQMLDIDDMGHRVVTSTHDEVVCVVKNARAERCYKDMMKRMREPLDWCFDIPLNCEGGYADNYSK